MSTRWALVCARALALLALSVVASAVLSLAPAGAATHSVAPKSFSPKLLTWETNLLLGHSIHVEFVLDTSAGFETATVDRGVVQSESHGVLTLARADKEIVTASLTHATKFEGIGRAGIEPGDRLAVVAVGGVAAIVRDEANGVPPKFLTWETKLLINHSVHAALLVNTSQGFVTADIDHGIVETDVSGMLTLAQADASSVTTEITKATRFAGIARSKISTGDHLVVVQESGDAVLVARSGAATSTAPLG